MDTLGEGGEQRDGSIWVPPALFEGYRLVRPLGAGGMGRVYLCHDLLLDRPVAIKFISHADPDGRRRERFLLEGRALARLVHPNVVFTFRVGNVEDRPFLVSEFVAGLSLEQIEKPVHWRRALEIGIGLARGLAAAHRAGILHRDVKPENVMLSSQGDVKLIDFGLATFVSEDGLQPPRPRAEAATSRVHSIDETESESSGAHGPQSSRGHPLSRFGAVVGTRRYMAPERLEGNPASRQSDVFSLGCVLKDLCLDGPSHVLGRAPQPEVDPQFQRIVEKCLERDLVRRFLSADHLLREMEALADDTATFGEVPPGNPYRGLESFDVLHRACFLGRSREVATIVEKLRSEPVVVVAGDSGVGKSSICKAGVIPWIEQSNLLPGRPVAVMQLVPSRDPLTRLAEVIAGFLSDAIPVIRERLIGEPTEVLRSLGRVAGERTIVILVDQTEELFTLATVEDAANFAELLSSLALLGSHIRVLITVRGDFLARLAALPGLGAEVARAPYLLRPLTADKLREVIVVPARRSGVSFASSTTVDELIRFAMASEGSLPLLQFTLAELWEGRDRGTNIIRADALAALGGVDGVFERHADRVLASLPPQRFAVARRLLSRFVTAQGTRASLTRSELRHDAQDGRTVLETLIAGRLVVARGSDAMTIYELAHEALITRWSTLRQWLDEDAAQKRAFERLMAAASEWDRLGRRQDGLWSGRQLADAEAVETSHLGAGERDFLEASRAGRRKARLLRVGLPLALSLVALLAVLGGRLRARAEIAATVSRSLDSGRHLAETARAYDDQATRLRVNAMRLFDEGAGLLPGGTKETSWKDAEQIWSRILEMESEAEAGYGQATTALESALFVDPSQVVVRGELARLTDIRLTLAERMHHRDLQAELSERLRSLILGEGSLVTHPDDATLLLTAPSNTNPSVTIASYAADNAGRLTLGPERHLVGREQRLPPGSYLVMASFPGYPPVRIPVLLARHQTHVVTLPLPSDCSVPSGFILVPASDSLTGSDEENIRAELEDAPLHPIRLPSYLVGRFEVTIAEYLVWLETLPPAERARRAPNSHTDPSSVVLRQLRDGHWEITLKPSITEYVADWGTPIHYRGRAQHALQDWRRFPVTGVSFNDAVAYAEWLDRTGRIVGAHVCRDIEWEKAARGADGRIFTTGRSLRPLDADFVSTYGGTAIAFGPDEVGSHPQSASPYGVEDVHGNAYEMVASSRWDEKAAILGGSWDREQAAQRLDSRYRQDPFSRNAQFGFRICASLDKRHTPQLSSGGSDQ
jgi:eukaryotic-like serine/threonine-protein kinase